MRLSTRRSGGVGLGLWLGLGCMPWLLPWLLPEWMPGLSGRNLSGSGVCLRIRLVLDAARRIARSAEAGPDPRPCGDEDAGDRPGAAACARCGVWYELSDTLRWLPAADPTAAPAATAAGTAPRSPYSLDLRDRKGESEGGSPSLLLLELGRRLGPGEANVLDLLVRRGESAGSGVLVVANFVGVAFVGVESGVGAGGSPTSTARDLLDVAFFFFFSGSGVAAAGAGSRRTGVGVA
jgi:hypothetical protein